MNPDAPQTPREEIEVRLTALLMGELAPEEAAALQSLLAADPALAALHARLARAVELLCEASALPEQPAPPVPAQLSAEKRERLLAHFKNPAPAPAAMIVKPKRNWKPYVPLGLAATLVALIGLLSIQMLKMQRMESVLAGSGIADPRLIVPPQPLAWFLPKRNETMEAPDFTSDGAGLAEVGQTEARWDSQPGSAPAPPRDDFAGGKVESLAMGQIRDAGAQPDSDRKMSWSSQPGAVRGYVAGGSGGVGANANATQWMFNKPAEPETPTSGRTAFWSEDEASKLKVNTATEGIFWDTPARESDLARGEKYVPASPAINPPPEQSIAANTNEFAAARGGSLESIRRSVRFVPPPASAPPPPIAPTTTASTTAGGINGRDVEYKLDSSDKMHVAESAPAALTFTAAPEPVALGTDVTSDPATVASLLAPVPDAGVISTDGKDRFGRAGERTDLPQGIPREMGGRMGGTARASAGAPMQLPATISGVAPAPAGPGNYDRGLSKHMDGAFGDKLDMGNVAFAYGTTAKPDAPGEPLVTNGNIALPGLAPTSPTDAPAGAKRAYFFDTDSDGFADLNQPKLAPASGPAPSAPALPEILAGADFTIKGFGRGGAVADAKEGKLSGSERTTGGRDKFFKESAGTTTLDSAVRAPVTAALADGTAALGFNRAGLVQLEKGKASNERLLSSQAQRDDVAALGDLQKKEVAFESEGRVMRERTDDFGTTLGGLGGVALENKSRSQDWSGQVKPDALAWFGQADASGKDTPANRELAEVTRGRAGEDNVELALGEKPVQKFASPRERGGEPETAGRLSFSASQPSSEEYSRKKMMGAEPEKESDAPRPELRAKNKAASAGKPGLVAKNETKPEAQTKGLFESVDEFGSLYGPDLKQLVTELSDGDSERVVRRPVPKLSDKELIARESRLSSSLVSLDDVAQKAQLELKAQVNALVSKHTGATNQARNTTRGESDEMMDEYRKGVEVVKELNVEIESSTLGKDVLAEKTRTRDEKLAGLEAKQREITASRLEKDAALKKENEADMGKLRNLLETNRQLAATKLRIDGGAAAAIKLAKLEKAIQQMTAAQEKQKSLEQKVGEMEARGEDDGLKEYQKGVDAVKKFQAEIAKMEINIVAQAAERKKANGDSATREFRNAVSDPVVVAKVDQLLKAERDLDALATKLEEAKKQAAQKISEDKPAEKKNAEPAPVPQPEIATSANAFSTFSLNVADVSFKLAAASLEKGAMPEVATVRSEEFINAFDYRDPEPAGAAPLAFAMERARYPFAQNRDLLRLSVKTAAAGRQPGRALNVVLLLDNSGSMERADRVRILHEALRVLAAQLQSQDKLSVVTFARTPRLWADGVAGDKAGEVTARVGEITPQGGTNLSAALDLGYATARKHFQTGGINRVVLLTDGAANLGDVNPDALKQKVEAQRRQGVALDCFGIGWEGYDDTLLEALSRNGDGRYGFLNSPEEAATEFAGQLAGALRVAASDVKVQVEWNPRRVTAWRQIGYAKHQLKKEQFRDNRVDAAEIGAAESGNALYAVEVNPRGTGDLATVRVRFKVPGTSDYREHEWTVPFTREAAPLEQASPALRLAGTASAFSEWLTSSPYATEVTPDRLLGLLNGVPATFGADPRPQKLEWMIRQAKSVSGR